ncbi:Putative sodium-dependent excitatory amino acid transporter glt-6 [Eumeta japonica]|uniref:Amino acid transporter n=1 Tax=Eumeta variegata TaxID=151549 RepID=A0A4C1Z845_EUMVA|nr:Putative sodium-dependent excitatory amino acid transporter glt-6 [Eumeta japonica]
MNSKGKPKTFTDRYTPVERQGLAKWLVDNTMLFVTLAGVFAGIAIGFGFRSYNLGADALLLISYPGELFMRVLKLMILPLIIASLIAGSASLNAKMSGKIAAKANLTMTKRKDLNVKLDVKCSKLSKILLLSALTAGKPTFGRRRLLDPLVIYETWLNANHTLSKTWTDNTAGSTSAVPMGKGERLIIGHAGTVKGFVPDALLAFKSQKTGNEFGRV